MSGHSTDGTPLSGQHAVVTGGGRGIGAAIAAELARLGADLTLMGRDAATLEDRRRTLAGTGTRVTTTTLDVRDPASVEVAFLAARRFHGDVAILVNNAGVAHSAALVRTTRDQWQETLDVNLTGAFLCIAQVLPAMIEARRGRIVNVASAAGLRGFKYVAAYCASKHGLVGLTRALALETAARGVTVNAVCPGYVETEMTERAVATIVERTGRSQSEARAAIAEQNASGRLVRPEEVAQVVARLCLRESDDINGEAIPVEGDGIVDLRRAAASVRVER